MLVAPHVRRIACPNPSPMTGPGTNTYLVGEREVAVVDPGPDHAGHLDAVEAAVAESGGRITHILVTHGHGDHLPGAYTLRTRTGAPVLGWATLAGLDQALGDGDRVQVGDLTISAHFTPGHAADHLVYLVQPGRALLAGDLVSGFGTVVVSPPAGSLLAYLASLRRAMALESAVMLPGHWEPIADPRAKFEEYLTHRADRERHYLAAMAAGCETTLQIVEHVYAGDILPQLVPAAQRTVLANLIKLQLEGRVAEIDSASSGEQRFRLVS